MQIEAVPLLQIVQQPLTIGVIAEQSIIAPGKGVDGTRQRRAPRQPAMLLGIGPGSLFVRYGDVDAAKALLR